MMFEGGFDAVVSDAVMPHLTGHDLCRILRQNDVMKDVPLIILSGIEQENALSSQESRADAYLLKSSRISEELIEKLSELLNRKANWR